MIENSIGSLDDLNRFLKKASYSSVTVLMDENTKNYCLPLIKDTGIKVDHYISVSAGEKSKDLEVCADIWSFFQLHRVDRRGLLINLGGGMITDLGGFCAATYKRGIDFINIPTTLLSMVDAAIGGKVGINFNHQKNNVGCFASAKMIIQQLDFLKTLPKEELISGYAELVKHALICDSNLFEELLKGGDLRQICLNDNLIERAAQIKLNIVQQDPIEKSIRKSLNFGHTIGHALESVFMVQNKSISHGFAVAMGMLCESYLSYQKELLHKSELNIISEHINSMFNLAPIDNSYFSDIVSYCLSDKKNIGDGINCTLIGRIGCFHIDQMINEKDVLESLKWYQNQLTN